MYSVNLNFWSNVVNIRSDNDEIIEMITYIYKNYVCDSKKSILYFEIEEKKECLKILTNDYIDSVKYSYDEEHYKSWDSADAFLPPFNISPLKGKFLVFHGCAVEKDGVSYLFMGPSMSGKTTLLLELLNRGYRAIADDLVIIENGVMIPYKKPVGFRNIVGCNFPNINETVNKMKYIPRFKSSINIETALVHLEDIFEDPFCPEKRGIDYIFLLNTDKDEKDFLHIQKCYNIARGQICNTGMNDDMIQDAVFSIFERAKEIQIIESLDIRTIEMVGIKNE